MIASSAPLSAFNIKRRSGSPYPAFSLRASIKVSSARYSGYPKPHRTHALVQEDYLHPATFSLGRNIFCSKLKRLARGGLAGENFAAYQPRRLTAHLNMRHTPFAPWATRKFMANASPLYASPQQAFPAYPQKQPV